VDELLAAADRNMRLAWESLLSIAPQREVTPIAGAVALASGIPISLFNPVFAFERVAEPEALVDALCGLDRPFVLYFRDETNPDLGHACASRAELVEHYRPPLMVLTTEPTRSPSLPDGVSIEEVTPDTLEGYAHVLAAGFGMPPELVALAAPPAFLELEAFTSYLASLDGAPVATATGFDDGHGTKGIYNVATVPEARGRGIGAAVTAAACRWSAGDVVVLQSSAEGAPVYERLGFATPDRYRQYERADVDGH
jgi:GNAT superfamily N-acetyltransferase